jgi:alkylation response protein AidB-like acyl-CoA dehydrogenase
MTITSAPVSNVPKGGAFLLEDVPPSEIFTAEDLSEEHLAVAHTVEEFWKNEIEPNLDALRRQEPGVALDLLRKMASLGLTAIAIPERFGGMEMDLPSVMAVGERIGRDGSFAGWYSAHTGIGTLPILLFGTEAQKQKYLPKLASVELLAAYALTEPLAGSDAMNVRTRADLAPDGKHYILSGQKMWITNGGAADLFTVFAKVGGEKFTAFLVERSFPGVSSGAEEHKMGIKGSSTTAVYLDNVPVPLENVLGEVGRGHIIAFNILNIGRLKLGPGALGGAKNILAISAKYAKQRKAFGTTISEFGAIQQKLAEMTIRIYATESMVWRVVGLIQNRMESLAPEPSHSTQEELKAVEEYAAECSIIKVYASEMLDYVADEGVQIHGGYGYHQDYAVERYYRDSRINRIFEGTSEINRLIIASMLLKRAAQGQLPLLSRIEQALKEAPSAGSKNDEEMRLVSNAKRIALLTIGLASRKYGTALTKEQEVLMSISEVIMQVFAMESSLLRQRKLAASGQSNASNICAVFLRDAMDQLALAAKNVIAACSEGPALGIHMATLRNLAAYEPVNAVVARRTIARRVLDGECYGF